MRRITLVLTQCLAAALTGPIAAQQAQGEFLVAAPASTRFNTRGGLFLVSPLTGTVKSLNATGPLAHSYSLHCDPYLDSVVWVGTTRATPTAAPAIYRVTAAGGRVVQTTRLNVGLSGADQTVSQVHVLGHQLMFLTSTQLSLVPVTGGPARVLLKFSPSSGLATHFACDGRSLYLNMLPSRTLLAEHVLRYDLELLTVPAVIYQSASITHMVSSLTMDGDGNLLLAETEAFSGSAELKHFDPTGKPIRTLKLPFTHGTAGVRMDPASSTLVVGGKRFDATRRQTLTGFVTYLNWRLFKSEFGASPEVFGQIAARRHLPLSRYGHVCEAKGGWRAEISAVGAPLRGNATYQLLLQGRAGRPVLLLFGLHGAMPTPFPLALMGAGTCELGVRSIAGFGFRIASTGRLTVPAPIPTAVGNVELDVQFLVGDPTANAAGFVSSQVGSIVVR